MGHTFSKILLHVVFSTKGRRNFLYKDMRPTRHFGQLGLDTARGFGIMNTGQREAVFSEQRVNGFFAIGNRCGFGDDNSVPITTLKK